MGSKRIYTHIVWTYNKHVQDSSKVQYKQLGKRLR